MLSGVCDGWVAAHGELAGRAHRMPAVLPVEGKRPADVPELELLDEHIHVVERAGLGDLILLEVDVPRLTLRRRDDQHVERANVLDVVALVLKPLARVRDGLAI